MPRDTRHTKIIFTAGPATEGEAELEALVHAGVDICRLNMAHADHAWTRGLIARARAVCDRAGRQIAFMMDVKGPEIRTGDLPTPLVLAVGDLLDFTVTAAGPSAVDSPGDPQATGDTLSPVPAVTVNYPGLVDDVAVGDTVLVDSGLIRLEVMDKRPGRICCRVVVPGLLGSRRHINLPGVKVNLPALTPKDQEDILVGVEGGVEFFALSFVREPGDLDILRWFIKQHGSQARVIAKVEDQTGLANLEAIIDAADGLMVARGDLGIEIPFEQLPAVQRRAVKACLQVGKPVIIATHLLESMVGSPLPTRAEITDVANAVHEQVDCVMLSGETTTGKYPLECVRALARIIAAAQEFAAGPGHNTAIALHTAKAKMLRSAVVLAGELDGAGILVFTRSGFLARVLASLRPHGRPIYAFTDIPLIFRQSLILWGVEPFLMEFSKDPEETIQRAFATLKEKGWVAPGDHLVVITNLLVGEDIVDSLQVRRIDMKVEHHR